jgi:hypothetical protein
MRAEERLRFDVRLRLGGRLFAQMMAESSVLAIAGLLVGIGFVYFARNLLSDLDPPI